MLYPLVYLLATFAPVAGQPPKAAPPGNPDPAPPPNRFPGTARAAREEAELLEAHLATKEAYVKAAEVAVEGPKVKLTRVSRLARAGTVTEDEVEAAKVEVRLAEVQVAIRKAEANEVAVRLKHVRARVERAGKQAAAEPKLRALTAAAGAAREQAEAARREVERPQQDFDLIRKRTADPRSRLFAHAEERLKEAMTRAEAAEVNAVEAEAALARLRDEVEGGTGK